MSVSDMEDHQIVEQMRELARQNQDHSEMFENYGKELFRRFYHQAYLLARYYGLSREDAEEVVQDTFVKAFRGIRKFKVNASFKPWFFKILLNVTRDRHRLLKKNRLIFTDEILESEKNIFEEFHIREHIRGSIDRLPLKLKQTVLLRIYAELDHKSIADILKVSVRQVHNRLNTAYERLKRILEEDFE